MRARFSWTSLAVVAVLAVLVAGLAGCGYDPGLRDRYIAEKLAWQAAKLGYAMQTNPGLDTEEMREALAAKYREVVRRFPPPDDASSLSVAQSDVARLSGQSRLRLAELAEAARDADGAIRFYASVRDSYAFDRELAVNASFALAGASERAGRWDGAVDAYERLASDWPPAESETAAPDLRILRAPLAVATGYTLRGDERSASASFERARDYLSDWVARWPQSPTAEVAASFRAETFLMQERWTEGVRAYEAFDEEYGTDANRPSVWLTLGDTYSRKLNRSDIARTYYLRVLERYPDEIAAATAALALATDEIERGQHEEARARLEDVVERFAGEETARATAMQYIALSFERQGQWESAAAQLNALAREHPTTMYGLIALRHVAEHYEEAGETTAAEAALERAADHYERVIRDYAGTPAELAARGYLADTRTRQERWQDAVRVLLDTAERYPDSDSSPVMMFQAAELQRGELGDAGAARRILESIRDRYAGRPAGDEADRRLAELGG